MKEIWNTLTAEGGILRVRAIFTFVVVGAYGYLAVMGDIPVEAIKEVTIIVAGFYFITRAATK
jgi:hypothetical protein